MNISLAAFNVIYLLGIICFDPIGPHWVFWRKFKASPMVVEAATMKEGN